MEYYEDFRYCPRCGTAFDERDFDPGEIVFRCRECCFHFYQNPIPSAAVIIPLEEQEHRVMLIKRGTEPSIGLLALPGGMLGYRESGESAAIREVEEETGIEIRIRSLFEINHVDYEFQGRTYSVLEHEYLAYPVNADSGSARSTPEAPALGFYDVAEIRRRQDLAFSCHFDVLKNYAKSIAHSAAKF